MVTYSGEPGWLHRSFEVARAELAKDLDKNALIAENLGMHETAARIRAMTTPTGSAAAKLVAYADCTAVARELGYPSLTEALEDLERLKATPSPSDTAAGQSAPQEVWDRLALHTNLSLQAEEPDMEGEPLVWAVYRVSGGRSDREWERIATGVTPLAALQVALPTTPGADQ